MKQQSSLYLDSCPECDSLDVRLVRIVSDPPDSYDKMIDREEIKAEIRCEECAAEWLDYIGNEQ